MAQLPIARDTSRMDDSWLELSRAAGRLDLYNTGKRKHFGEFAASPEKASSCLEVHIYKR